MTDVLMRPTPLSRVWSGSKIIADDLDGGDLADVLELQPEASAWWVLDRDPDQVAAQLRDIASALDLDTLAIADLVADDQRAKFEELGGCRLVITNAVTLDPERSELKVHPVAMVVTDRALICLVHQAESGFHVARRLAGSADKLAAGGVDAALRTVLVAVLRSYAEVVDWLEDSSDKLADALFEERPLTRDEQLWTFRLRSVLAQLRRLTDPMRSVMDELVESYDDADQLTRRRWSALAEEHHRVANSADRLLETLASVFDTSLALADLRMNSIMKKLTGWAAVIAVPTLVTGFVGMNVSFPLDGTVSGFWVYLGIMAVAVVVLYVIFRRKDWL